MDAITSYMSRRKGLKDAVSRNRDQRSLQRRAGSIGGVRNVGTDSAGRRVVMPTSAQISGGTAPPAFYRSMAPTRADRVRSAMADGSFGGIRAKFNESQAGKQVMEPDGTIRAHNPYRDGGQLGGSETVTAPTPGVPAAPTQPTPPAPVATKPVQQPAGPPVPGSKPGESLARTGVIRDETGDITNRIRSSMAGGQATPTAPAKPDPLMASAQKLQDAAAGIKSATAQAANTQSLLNTKRLAPQAATSATPAPAKPRPVDSTLIEPRGFGAVMPRLDEMGQRQVDPNEMGRRSPRRPY